MRKLFKNMLPYWHIIVVIFLLLGVQAYCDLSLPQYTSDIIDVGIQNKGIKHILPEKMPEEEYQLAELFMTDGEKDTFEAVYEKKDDTYVCTADKETLETLDDELLTPIVLTYRMANMSETDFKNTIAEALEQNPQNQITKESLDEMSIEEIGQMMQMELTTYEAEMMMANGNLCGYASDDEAADCKRCNDAGWYSTVQRIYGKYDRFCGKQYLTCHGNSICNIL